MPDSTDQNGPNSSEQQQYYRLVPVTRQEAEQQKRLNLKALFSFYWNKRGILYWCVGACFALGLIFALLSPKKFSSQASIVPEYELQDRVNEIIESYGLLFGLTGSIRENRTPSYLLELYPYMIETVDFKLELMHRSFEYQGRKITLAQYFTDLYHPSLLHKLYNYTFGLPGTLMDALQSDPAAVASTNPADSTAPADSSAFPILDLSSREKKVVRALSSRIQASYDRRSGIVRISGTMPEASLAPKLVKLVLQTLHRQASAYKTAKARLYMDFLESQQKNQKKRLEQARQELITFNGADSQPLNKRMELQSNYEIHLDQYNTLTQQLQRMKLNIQEQLPAFRILDDITTPGTKIKPDRKIIILLSLLLGFSIGMSWITVSFLVTKAKSAFVS